MMDDDSSAGYEEDEAEDSDYVASEEEDLIGITKKAGKRRKKNKTQVKKEEGKKEEEQHQQQQQTPPPPSLLEAIEGDEVVRGSAKLRRLIVELDRLVFNPPDAEEEGRKAVVFSQWTFMLDLICRALQGRRWSYARLDGSTPQAKREAALHDFATRKDVRVMVISLKAGGVGLNLTSASVCFLMDPWWNPAIEDQAVDRIHRLGQTRDVRVIRFTVKDTVEQQMLKIQEKKAAIAQNALACFGNKDKNEGRLNLEELRRFFV